MFIPASGSSRASRRAQEPTPRRPPDARAGPEPPLLAPSALRPVSEGPPPNRLPSVAPVEAQSPARQGFARIPLALAIVEHAAGAEAIRRRCQQRSATSAWSAPTASMFHSGASKSSMETKSARRPWSGARPGRPDRARPLAQRVQRRPTVVLEGPGDAHRLDQAGDTHLEAELDPGRLDQAADRRRGSGSAAWRPAAGGPRRTEGPR